MLSRRVLEALLCVAFIFAADPAAAKTPSTITYQGYLRDRNTGKPVTGQRKATFKIFDAAFGGTEKWKEEHPSINISGGYFEAILGLTTPLTGVFDGSDLYMEITIGGETLSPRKQITSVPYALVSAKADHAISADSAKTALQADQATNATNATNAQYCSQAKDFYVSGNLGVGVSKPLKKVQVAGDIEATGDIYAKKVLATKSTARIGVTGGYASSTPGMQGDLRWWSIHNGKGFRFYFYFNGAWRTVYSSPQY